MLSSEFEAVARKTAESFRLGMEAQGSGGLVALIDALPSLLAEAPERRTGSLNRVLSVMLEAQARKDYLFLADYLEYELIGLLWV